MFGIFLLVTVALLGGLIAFVGDRVGMRVGRKRLTIFGLRPKYTSMAIAIITGVLTAASTLGILSIASENVRIALFHLAKLRRDLAAVQARNVELKKEYNDVNADLRGITAKWRAAQSELAGINERIAALTAARERAEKDLREARANLASKAADLGKLEEQYAQAEERRAAAEKAVKVLQARKDNLENAIAILEGRIETLTLESEHLGTGVLDFATQPIIIHLGEVLAAAVVKPGKSFAEIEGLVVMLLNKADQIAKDRGASIESKTVATRVDIKRLADAYKILFDLKAPAVVRVVSGTNTIAGKPAFVYLEVLPDEVVFRKGETVAATTIDGEDSAEGILTRLVAELVTEVKKAAAEKGMVDAAGEVSPPVVDPTALQEVAAGAAKLSGQRRISFVAARDLRRAGETLDLIPVLGSR